MLIPFSHYPVRPQVQPGESLMGYVYRFYSANGYCIPYTINKWVRTLSRGWTEEFDEAFKVTQSIFGNVASLNCFCWIRVRQHIDSDRPESSSYWLERSHQPAAYCPTCLHESGFYYELWEYLKVEVCPLHACRLVTRCPSCLSNFSWCRLLTDWRCFCGLEMTTVSAEPVMPYSFLSTNKVTFMVFPELPTALKQHLERALAPYAEDRFLRAVRARRENLTQR